MERNRKTLNKNISPQIIIDILIKFGILVTLFVLMALKKKEEKEIAHPSWLKSHLSLLQNDTNSTLWLDTL